MPRSCSSGTMLSMAGSGPSDDSMFHVSKVMAWSSEMKAVPFRWCVQRRIADTSDLVASESSLVGNRSSYVTDFLNGSLVG